MHCAHCGLCRRCSRAAPIAWRLGPLLSDTEHFAPVSRSLGEEQADDEFWFSAQRT